MKAIPLGRSETHTYQVYYVEDCGRRLCVVTVYDSGQRLYDFDGTYRYTKTELDEIINIGQSLTGKETK